MLDTVKVLMGDYWPPPNLYGAAPAPPSKAYLLSFQLWDSSSSFSLPDAVRTLECLISGSSSQIGHTISYWASNLGYFSHPFLYGLLNRSIRKELYKIFNIHQTGSTGLRVRKRHVTTLPKIPERRISMPEACRCLSYNQSNEKIGVPPYLVHWRKNKEMTNSSDPSSNNRRTSEPINF
ncbi:unnamed protein product [Lepeophtheirus salmonis]|uniref:(salmon louse) hypothetical protein n=1 Tax=Lepeophtheirus salmonis TaxID=72036 RepID=A0A7R8D2Q3_LEPSM|nr:unnamed protein product [Lepeophtheirus salmonis]CAF3007738.1 unnamed protein product [Lepeophtheirus salmonis]